MAHRVDLSRFPDRLVSPRGAWRALGVAMILMLLAFGILSGAQAPARTGQAPASSEASQVSALLERFPDAGRQSVLIVATRADGSMLTRTDIEQLAALRPAPATGAPMAPVISEDGAAALLSTPITVGSDSTETAAVIANLRAELSSAAPPGLVLQVTGGPAFGADVAAAFDGADLTLLLVTILIVAVLLILTYRSPVLWLVPLTVIAVADGLAGRVSAAAGSWWNLAFDAGIVSVLVFGAGTNYALLLISRYREELHRTDDHRAALSMAWRATAPAILASNVTVVLALFTLLFASIPMTRGLGIPAAIGLLIALAAVLFVLPPLLAVCGRRVFWPMIPGPGVRSAQGRTWRGLASRVSAHPTRSLLGGLALLAVMATGLPATSLGLDQMQKFRGASPSASGLATLSAHFSPGAAQPIWIVTDTDAAPAVVAAAGGVEGVTQVRPTGQSRDGALTRVMVTSAYSPGTAPSLAQIGELRTAVHTIEGASAMVGGTVAADVDARAGNEQDLRRVPPLVLAVSFLVLLVLLRALVAPAVLLLVNLVSAVAAIGGGAWLSRMVFDQRALDLQVPILAFLFLVALGIDYTIFLVHRARHEADRLGTRAGMIEAVAHTGSVITSAGIVLAAVFAALGVLPLVTLGQLGVIVGVGVLVDTLVVRTVIVPALFALAGQRMWWPGKLLPTRGESTYEHRAHSAVAR